MSCRGKLWYFPGSSNVLVLPIWGRLSVAENLHGKRRGIPVKGCTALLIKPLRLLMCCSHRNISRNRMNLNNANNDDYSY